ncbi:hypothetical protein [Micromonospora viridifaciens]|uniref:hypothetical protein n=1 Tax=Micromonospora viridifaciens TaxID=1881 RepID=UPI00142DBFE8|nr:hypothetical protein [Micromonospora viridifaciens]
MKAPTWDVTGRGDQPARCDRSGSVVKFEATGLGVLHEVPQTITVGRDCGEQDS